MPIIKLGRYFLKELIMSFKIGSFKIETENIFNILKKADIKTDTELKMLDKNGDKIISEDEFVDITELIEEDENNENSQNSTSLLNEQAENQILSLYQQLDNQMEQRRRLFSQMGTAQNLDESKSLQSQLQNYNSQIQSTRDQIFQIYYNMEVQAANASATAMGTANPLGTSATSSYTYSGNNEQFVNTFNNSSFQKGVLAGKGFRPSEDNAVNHNKGDEDAQRGIKVRNISLHYELQDCNQRSYDYDITRNLDFCRNNRSYRRRIRRSLLRARGHTPRPLLRRRHRRTSTRTTGVGQSPQGGYRLAHIVHRRLGHQDHSLGLHALLHLARRVGHDQLG